MKNHFISIDWGTTNFRLRIVEVPEMKVLEEISSDMGIKAMNERIKASVGDRKTLFFQYMQEELKRLNSWPDLPNLVLVSGMASANIGLKELPYASLPFDRNGTGIITDSITHPDYSFSIFLISGVRNEEDVMRGEETQVIGLIDDCKIQGDAIFILPGTHSKHIFYQEDQFVDFRTYMTGEMFS
ncbi:MAG: 2-dehydro-3-deoxygalactonokinase, partial [Bacteroidetes bacterium]|nr:2-dehydro-3-deoxygalactonokinase [Bacteroidota bacterium]